jgi:hypothetical protein
MRPALPLFAMFAILASTIACPIGVAPREGEGEGEGGEGEGEGEDYPEPRSDVAVPVGEDGTLEIMAWNLKNFPCGNSANSTVCRSSAGSTPELVADILYSLRVDLVCVEEVDDIDAFQELVDRLPHHEGVLSSHTYGDGTYQKIGFLYDTRVLALNDDKLIFDGNFDFPRPPMEGAFTYTGGDTDIDLVAIGVHLKAGGAPEDHDRRLGAVDSLESYVRGKVDGSGADAVFVLGDFNDTVTDSSGRAVFAPFLDGARYVVRTEDDAQDGGESFLFSGAVIDHIVSTIEVEDAFSVVTDAIVPLDAEVDDYEDRVSDHLPVLTKLQAR